MVCTALEYLSLPKFLRFIGMLLLWHSMMPETSTKSRVVRIYGESSIILSKVPILPGLIQRKGPAGADAIAGTPARHQLSIVHELHLASKRGQSTGLEAFRAL